MSGFLAPQSAANQTEAIYIAYFGRAADGPGYLYWTASFASQAAAGVPITTAAVNTADSFAVQPEATQLYAFLASPPAMLSTTDAVQIAGVDQFLGQVYENLFNRAADTAGEAFWQQAILSGAVSIGSAVYAIANGAQNTAANADQTVLAAKIAAAYTFTTKTYAANLGMTTPLTTSFLTAARASVATVTDASSEAASQAATTAYIASAQAATYTLAQALAATSLPGTYNLSNTSADLGRNLTVAAATADLARAQTIVSGALNASSLPPLSVTYTLNDTLANLAANSSVVTGANSYALTNGSFNLGTALTVAAAATALAQAQALFNGATNHTSLVLTPTYALADTLANLFANSTLVSGASTYALTDPAGNLGVLSVAQASLVAGATDASQYTYQTVGNTFTLTTGPDVIPGLIGSNGTTSTAGDITIIGTVNPGTGTSTLNPGDSLTGGSGNNLLKIVDSAGADSNDLAGVTLSHIQTVQVQNASGGPVTADFATAAGVSTVIAFNTATGGSDSFTGLAAGTQVIASGAGTGGSTWVAFAYAAPTDAVSLAVDGGVKDVTFANINTAAGSPTTATIASTGAANGTVNAPEAFILTPAGNATLTTLTVNATANLVAELSLADYAPTAGLTVSGAATIVNFETNTTDFKTINASGLTGGGLSITAGTNLIAFTGGGGGGNVLDLAADFTDYPTLTLNGGGGTNNTIGLIDTDFSLLYTPLNALSNFQSLALTGDGASIDLTRLTNAAITKLVVNDTAGNSQDIISGFGAPTSAVTAVSLVAEAAGVTVNAATGGHAVNLALDGTATSAASVGAILDVAGTLAVNLASNGTAGVADNRIAGLLATNNNATVTVTGSQNLSISGLQFGSGIGDTGILDASNFQGNLTLTTDSNGGSTQIINTGSGVSLISVANVVADTLDTFNLGSGRDTIKFLNPSSSVWNGTAATDVINKFVSGQDTLDLTDINLTTLVSNASIQAAITSTVLSTALGQAASVIDAATDNVGYAVIGGNTYVIGNVGSAWPSDFVVELKGITSIASTDLKLA